MLDPLSGSSSPQRFLLSRRTVVKGITGAVATAALGVDLTSCGVSGGLPRTFSVGQFLVDLSQEGIRVRHQMAPSRSLWQSIQSQPFVQAGIGNAVFREFGDPLGSFEVTDTVSSLSQFQSFDFVNVVNSSNIVLNGALRGAQSILPFRIALQAISGNQLQFILSVSDSAAGQYNRIFLNYASDSNEAFFGFGQQLTYFNQKGNVLPILVQEHGIGRGLPGLTDLINELFDGAGGTPYLTAAPAPQYITSELRSLFLENREYSVFDMTAADHVAVKLFSGVMTGRIIFGETPLDLIEEFTSYSGRVRPLPDWAHAGAIVGAEGGNVAVDPLLTELINANVPIAAFWLQDWSGKNVTEAGSQLLWNWQLNTTQYPTWDQLVERLAQYGARVLIYINPFLIPALCNPTEANPCPSELYTEALNNGYLVKRNGETFVYTNSTIKAGMLDLSNPGTRTWIKQVIQREMIGNAKASGWMGDFGEALPFDANLYQGADPQVWHNHYPEVWAQVQREAIDETGNGGDFLFWNRSGFLQSPTYSTAGWLGDQLQTWDEYDGIKSTVVGLLSGGISGYSILHSDTGGFNAAAFPGYPVIARSPELLMRWMELNAFTALFRTHPGLNPSISAQVDTNAQTLSHFARFATIFKALGPYRKTLVQQASANGYPVVRHLFLHFPNDPVVYTLRYQFLLGSDFLIAPVLDPGAETVHLYLPAGNWIHLWSGSEYNENSGTWIDVAAPLGQPGVFYPKGSSAGEQLAKALQGLNIL